MSAADAANGVLSAYEEKLNKVAPSSVLIQLGLMIVLSLLGVLGFSALRPKNSVIYQPRLKYSEDGKQPPKIEKGFFDWLPPVLRTSEEELVNTIGLDAVTYLRFLKMCTLIFLSVAILTCAVLLPINIAYNIANVPSSNRTYLSLLTIQSVRGAYLWAHVTMTYVITLLVCWFVWTNTKKMVELRWQWFRSEEYQNQLNSRSLIITQVAKRFQSDMGILTLFESLGIPYPSTDVRIGRRVGELPAMIHQHNDAVRTLEAVLTRYFKDPKSVPSKRPVMKVGGVLGGRKVDAIDYLTQKIQQSEERIELTRQQIGDKKAENYGFASFESVPYAHVVAKKLRGKSKQGARFDLAPLPKDIIWENITIEDAKRGWNQFVGGIILAVFLFFYTIPLLAVSLLANLAALSGYVRFIDVWSSQYSWLFSAFVGIVPPLLSLLLQLLLPVVIRWISSFQGATTHSQADRAVTARYSAFLLFSNLFIFSVIGVIINMITKVVTEIQGKKSAGAIFDYLKTVPDQFQSTWIIQSTYWLTVFPLRGSSAIFDLAQVLSLLTVWLRARLFGRTPRDIREWTKPPEFDYAVYYSNHLLMVAVGFVYAPLAPLVPLFACFAFATSYLVYRYQLMYVCVSRVETGGRLWRVAINRVLAGLIMMQLLMTLTIGLQQGWIKCAAVAPTLLVVIAFKIVLSRQFDDRFTWYIPTTAEIEATHFHHADAKKGRLQKRFGHPSLHEPLFTPMLHKDVQHLLPTIYNGRIQQTHGTVDGKAVQQNLVGGLTFNMLESHQLQYDRGAYLQRERDDDETTVASEMQRKAGASEFLSPQRQADYMQRGPKHRMYASNASEADLPMELRQMPAGQYGRSTENLIQYPSQYPPHYTPPPEQALHGRKFSQASQTTLGYYDGMETVQQGQYPPYQQGRGSPHGGGGSPLGTPFATPPLPAGGDARTSFDFVSPFGGAGRGAGLPPGAGRADASSPPQQGRRSSGQAQIYPPPPGLSSPQQYPPGSMAPQTFAGPGRQSPQLAYGYIDHGRRSSSGNYDQFLPGPSEEELNRYHQSGNGNYRR